MLPAEIPRRHFDVDEYHRMLEVGLLTEDDRVELIGGEIVEMAPIGSKHFACVTNLTHVLVGRSRGRFFVSVQSSIYLDDGSEPEPDFALLKQRPTQRDETIPSSEGVFALMEVSDTMLDYDRNVKLPLYAGAGIREVWIFNLQARNVEVHAYPELDTYREKRTFGRGEDAVSATLDGLTVSVDEVFS